MAAFPRRRKKGGKYVGNFYQYVDGKQVNLGTANAVLARKRARLALEGKWPDAKSAEEAGTVAAQAAEVAQETAPALPVGDAATADVPAGPGVGTPEAPAGDGQHADHSAPTLDVAATAAAAAQDVEEATAQVLPEVPAERTEQEEIKAELQALLGAQLKGADGQEIEPGALAAATQLGAEHWLLSKAMGRLRPPWKVPEPRADGISFAVLAIGWRVGLKRWLSDLSFLGDLRAIHVIALGGGLAALGMILGAERVKLEAAAAATTPGA